VAARRCQEALSRGHDLTQYTTDAIVDDVEEVRATLGYGKVNLLGASYGTRAALVYLRRHPESVRTALLMSVVPQDARLPRLLALHTQAAFDRMAADCAAEPACRKAFPDPKADLQTVLDRLAASPATVAVRDKQGKETAMRLSRSGAAQTVRYLLYSPAGAGAVPVILRRAAAGDLQPLGQRAHDLAGFFLASPPDGLYLSVTCAEDVAFVDREEAERLAAGTFLGDFRLRQQIAACAEWPPVHLPAAFLEPIRSATPVLILAGENDPATPLAWAEQVARTLPGSRILAVPGGAHSFTGLEGIECTNQVAADFLTRGSAEKLDLETCRKAIRRPPFLLTVDDRKP
jgi:pimeloyl-ACP methyl ester carboxylesterase